MHPIKENSHMTTTDTTPETTEAVAATAPRECEYCGEALPPSEGRGRPKRFCDRTCRRAARKERAAAEAAEAAAEAPAAEEKPKPKAKAKAKKAEAEPEDDEDVI